MMLKICSSYFSLESISKGPIKTYEEFGKLDNPAYSLRVGPGFSTLGWSHTDIVEQFG